MDWEKEKMRAKRPSFCNLNPMKSKHLLVVDSLSDFPLVTLKFSVLSRFLQLACFPFTFVGGKRVLKNKNNNKSQIRKVRGSVS